MTHPDLEREIAELLPCHDPDWCDPVGRADPEDPRPPDPCPSCYYRPAILAWVQRKLDEARQAEVAPPIFADTIEQWHSALLEKLDTARADSDLLAKVEAWLKQSDGHGICAFWNAADWDFHIHVDDTDRFHYPRYAPTLREALRKLIE